jgi:hypothetical protein
MIDGIHAFVRYIDIIPKLLRLPVTIVTSGIRISPPPSHIPRGKAAFAVSDFADAIFLSSSIYYSSDTAYATPFETNDDIVQVVLECSVKINSFTSYPSTVPTYTAHPGEDPKIIE